MYKSKLFALAFYLATSPVWFYFLPSPFAGAIECDGTLTAEDCPVGEPIAAITGNYKVAIASASLYPQIASASTTLNVPACTGGPATIVQATVNWIIREHTSDDFNHWDETVDISRNGGSLTTVNSDRRYKSLFGGNFAVSSYVSDITSQGIVQPGSNSYEMFNLDSSPGFTHHNTSKWGFGLQVVYECSEFPIQTVQQVEGLDLYSYKQTADWDADRTGLICEAFTAATVARTINLDMFLTGSADSATRQGDLWYVTGTGAVPGPTDYDLMSDVNTAINGGIVHERLVYDGDPEYETHNTSFTLPANDEFICIQMDGSFNTTEHPNDATVRGASTVFGTAWFSYEPAAADLECDGVAHTQDCPLDTQSTFNGNYQTVLATDGTTTGAGSVTLNVPACVGGPATVVSATLNWAIRDDTQNYWEDGVDVSVDAGAATTVTHNRRYKSTQNGDYYSSYNADITSLVLAGSHTYAITNLDTSGVGTSTSFGFGIQAVYECPEFGYTTIEYRDGLDLHSRNFAAAWALDRSYLMCFTFAADVVARTATFEILLPGALTNDSEADIWGAVGSGATPTEDQYDLLTDVNTGANGGVAISRLVMSSNDPAFDSHIIAAANIPAGSTYACAQVDASFTAGTHPNSGTANGADMFASAAWFHLPALSSTTTDYGDAPDTGAGTGAGNYNTLATDSGASHGPGLNTSLTIGSLVDGEPGTLQDTTAEADNNDNTADEDGLATPSQLSLTDGLVSPGVDIVVTNNVGSAATLYGWIDYNGDGVFDNTTERASVAVPNGTIDGTVSLTFPTVPLTANADTGGTTFSRFRLSTDVAAANATGAATDGEVEDHQVTINQPLSVGGTIFSDADDNGLIGGGETGIPTVDVNLYRDTNGNGTYDSGTDVFVTSTTSDASGNYVLQAPDDGEYIVVIPSTELGVGQPLNGRTSSTGVLGAGSGPYESTGVFTSTLPHDNYLTFDGVNDHVDLGTFDITSTGEGFTMEAWIYPTNVGGGNQDIISKSTGTAQSTYTFSMREVGAGNVAQFRLKANNAIRNSFGGTLVDNTWQHIAMTYDEEVMVIYLDGVQVSSIDKTLPLTPNALASVFIGRRPAGGGGFQGRIDDVRFWSNNRTSAEIASSYQNELNGDETHLLYYYKFNDVSGQVATDSTANANHGELGTSAAADVEDPVWNGVLAAPPDPDTDIDSDDNGYLDGGGNIASYAITLSADTEPTTEDADANTNLTVDFGFYAVLPDLEVSKMAEGSDADAIYSDYEVIDVPPTAGSTAFTYQFVVSNASTVTDATNVDLTEYVSPGVTITGVNSVSQGSVATGLPLTGVSPHGTTTVLWDVGTVSASGSATLVLDAEVSDANLAAFIAGSTSGSNQDAAEISFSDQTDEDSVAGNITMPNFDPTTSEDDEDDARVYVPPAVGDYVWQDTDNDGIQDGGETGINGVTVTIHQDDDGTAGPSGGDTLINTAVTATNAGNDGYFAIGSLDPLTDYYLTYVVPTGYTTAQQDQGGDDTLDSDGDAAGETIVIQLVSGEKNYDLDMGFVPLLTHGGSLFYDRNNDGDQDLPGENGIGGVDIELYEDTDASGAYSGGDTLIASTTTAAVSGDYSFANLPEGNYITRIPAAEFGVGQPLENYVPATGTNGSATGPYEPAPDPDNDVDSDDNGEDLAGDYVTDPVTLSFNGEPITDGDTNTYTNLSVDLGVYEQITMGSLIWDDLNNNGLYDSGTESGITGVVVEAYEDTDASGGYSVADTLVGTQTTNGSGEVTFTGLASANYSLRVPSTEFGVGEPLENFISSSGTNGSTTGPYEPAPDPDNDVNNDDNGEAFGADVATDIVALTPGGEPIDDGDADNYTNLSVDLGFWRPSSFADFVWHDIDEDGEQDGGEVGLENITVNLYVSTDLVTPIFTTTTSAAGAYSFTNLAALDYVVEFIVPSGFRASPQDAVGDTIDSDGDATFPTVANTTGRTATISLAANTANTDVDMGMYSLMQAGNLVWLDLNNSGTVDNGETGIDGVDVHLYEDTNADNTYTAGTDTLSTTTTTAGGGAYLFDHLMPGNYIILIPSSEFGGGQELENMTSSTGTGMFGDKTAGTYEPAADVDADPTDNDDNGYTTGGELVTFALTIAAESEPITEDADNNTNLTVDLGFTWDRIYVSLGLDDNTMSLGLLSPSAVTSLSQQYTLATNNPVGANLYMIGEAVGLDDGGGNDIDNVSDGTVTAGSEEYGISLTSSMTLLPPFNVGDDPVPTAVTGFANSGGAPTTNDTVDITYKASVNNQTAAGSYDQVLTITVVANP